MTSPQIAVKFGVSERTIETHLGRVFTTLGIQRRADLAALLGYAAMTLYVPPVPMCEWPSPWLDRLVNRQTALDTLPPAYATALRLREAGADDGVIASGLGIEPESVGLLLEVASRKLDRLLVAEESTEG